jgi:hypothetical protein
MYIKHKVHLIKSLKPKASTTHGTPDQRLLLLNKLLEQGVLALLLVRKG